MIKSSLSAAALGAAMLWASATGAGAALPIASIAIPSPGNVEPAAGHGHMIWIPHFHGGYGVGPGFHPGFGHHHGYFPFYGGIGGYDDDEYPDYLGYPGYPDYSPGTCDTVWSPRLHRWVRACW